MDIDVHAAVWVHEGGARAQYHLRQSMVFLQQPCMVGPEVHAHSLLLLPPLVLSPSLYPIVTSARFRWFVLALR
jgi:hypothetical protein